MSHSRIILLAWHYYDFRLLEFKMVCPPVEEQETGIETGSEDWC
jgi:hypothetical protein